jgi:transposase-like protein
LRHGRRSVDVAAIVGRAASTLWVWVGGYRDGGLDAVAGHPRGHGSPPEPLTPADQAALRDASLSGQFASQLDAREWLVAQGLPELSRGQMARQFQLLQLRRKVPRPRSTKADPVAQAAFKKGTHRSDPRRRSAADSDDRLRG